MGAFENRDIRIPLGPSLEQSISSGSTLQGWALFTYEHGQEGVSRALTFLAQTTEDGPRQRTAEILACHVVPNDPLAASLSEALLQGARPEPPQPLVELAGILASLGAARSQAGAASVQSAAAPTMRNQLRGLASDEADWTVVIASIASTLGIPTSIISFRDRALTLVDTAIPISDAVHAVPSLAHFNELLSFLSLGGTLWLPLSGRVPQRGGNAALWAIADGLEALSGVNTSDWTVATIPQARSQEVAPVPFPFVLPVDTERPSMAVLQEAMEAILSAVH
jgi:hypothetical protein